MTIMVLLSRMPALLFVLFVCGCATGSIETHSKCGDGQLQHDEECDDNDQLDSGNGCSATCARNDVCGDGVVQSLYETCDDGNDRDDGNGCSARCTRNDLCGDGTVQSLFESCDDGDLIDDGHGCSASCQRNDLCGDGIVQTSFESCDDGKVLMPRYCAADCTTTLLSGLSFYFSTSDGDDARTPEEAQNPTTPWKTMNKLNTLFPSLRPGDAVLLRRGEVFDGPILVTASGTAEQPIVVGAYGVGARPVISGLARLLDWIPVGGGIYESECSACEASTNMLVLDGVPQPLGRYPDTGYLTFETHVEPDADPSRGPWAITDNELDETINWTGAEVVIRKTHWVIDRNSITEHSGNTLHYNSASTYPGIDGFGYFIQRDRRALGDRVGEWYWAPTTGRIQLYLGADNPAAHQIDVSVVETLVSVNGEDDVLFDNLVLRGANLHAISLRASAGISVQNCAIEQSGTNGITGGWGAGAEHLAVENNSIEHTHNNGIYLTQDFTAVVLRNNRIRHTGMIPGMGGNGDEKYNAVEMNGADSLIELNEIDHTGYIALNFGGDRTIVQRNVITHFCLVKDDGAGIYTYRHSLTSPVNVGRKVQNNIVLDGPGAAAGTTSASGYAHGIYIDGVSTGVDVIDNTVARCEAGIYINSDVGGRIADNLLYANSVQIGFSVYSLYGVNNRPHQNMTFAGNTFFSAEPSQLCLRYSNEWEADIDPTFQSDDNYFIRPMDDRYVISAVQSTGRQGYTLAGWRERYGLDGASKGSPVIIAPYQVNSLLGENKIENGAFASSIGGVSCWNDAGSCVAQWDDSGGLDGGALQISFAAVVPTSTSHFSLATGEISSDKIYILRFSLLGSRDEERSLMVYFLHRGSPWTVLSESYFVPIRATRQEHEILVQHPLTDAGSGVYFVFSHEDGPMWFDNMAFYEADVLLANPEEHFLFEVNPTADARLMAVPAGYVDVDGHACSGDMILEPYSSVVLIKDE